jgi:hypothetical protein
MNILFYTEPTWAYGSIHYELCKHLFKYNINGFLAPWNIVYKIEELKDLEKYFKYIVTPCHGYRALTKFYPPGLVKPGMFISIAHSESDIMEIVDNFGKDEFFKFHKFAVVSNYLKLFCEKLDIKRIPDICPLGINYDLYYSNPSSSLNTIGYAGATGESLNYIKRHHLVKNISDKTNLKLFVAHGNSTSYITMPTFYRSVDAIIVSSVKEGAGLPVLEASAAGKLVISTDVGHWKERSQNKFGCTLPIQEQDFVNKAIGILNFYKENPTEYYKKCNEIQTHAKKYDWSNVIDHWVKLFD